MSKEIKRFECMKHCILKFYDVAIDNKGDMNRNELGSIVLPYPDTNIKGVTHGYGIYNSYGNSDPSIIRRDMSFKPQASDTNVEAMYRFIDKAIRPSYNGVTLKYPAVVDIVCRHGNAEILYKNLAITSLDISSGETIKISFCSLSTGSDGLVWPEVDNGITYTKITE